MDVITQLNKTKAASIALEQLDDARRNQLLQSVADALRTRHAEILEANRKDLAAMQQNDPMYDRLLLTVERLISMADDIETVIGLSSPIDIVLQRSFRPNDLEIEKISVPLGVIAVIYESRPNVTVDVFALSFKAGNACVLKGGKEAYNSNLALVKILQKCLQENNITPDAVCLLSADRDDTNTLLNATGLIDVCIPRGGQALINYVRDNARVPVIETGAGIVHAYFDESGDLKKGHDIISNSKTRRVSVCNALDCLIINKSRIQDLYNLLEPLQAKNVEIFADQAAFAALQGDYANNLLTHASEEDFGREFLDYKLAVKTVDSIAQAIEHIRKYSSKHSEVIITEDKKLAKYFTRQIDAAVVYINASTAFTDGAQFGMGAEVGVSTQKLHARGPMGLEALTSYKWLVTGNGQVRA